jgi:hypothetical protein
MYAYTDIFKLQVNGITSSVVVKVQLLVDESSVRDYFYSLGEAHPLNQAGLSPEA